MRFFKVFTFVLLILCSVNAMALTNQQRAYLMKEKGYTPQQVAGYEDRVRQRQEDRKAGRTPSSLTDADRKILNDAKTPEAATYGQDQPGVLSKIGAWFAESTGMADRDMTGIMDALDELGADSLVIGATILAGVATGGLGAVTVFTGGVLWERWMFGDDSIIFNKIMRAFSSIDNGCWFCGIFEKLFNAVNAFAAAISNNMADAFIKLLSIFLLFYILFKVLKAVISFGEINPKEFLTDLFMPLLKTAIAIIVLYNMSFFYEKVVSPLAELSIGFSINMQETGRENITGVGQIRQVTREGGITTEENICSRISSYSTEGSGLSAGVNFSIQCFLRTISTQLIQDMAVGATFIAAAFTGGGFPKWSMLFIGIVMFLGCFFIFLSFPFKLLDGLFKLMFVCGLMPLWVILWVLPATREYSGKAFKMFLDVLITFICLSVIMMMVSIILYNALPNDFPEVIRLLAAGDDDGALEKINWSTGNFFMFVAMMFLALELLKKTDSFVSQFAGGSLGIGAGLEGWGRKGVQAVGSKVAKPIATKVAKSTGQLAGTALEKGWEGTKNLSKAAAKKSLYGAGYALGATKRGLRNLNSGPKLSAGQAMTPTGMIPNNPTGTGSGGAKPLNVKKTSPVKESLPDGKTKETEKTTFTDDKGKKKMEHTHETVQDRTGKEVSSSVKREKFDDAGNSTGSVTVEKDKVSGKKTLTEKDAKGKEVRTIIKAPDGTTTTQNNYVYDVDGKLSAFEKKIEEKIAGKMTVTKHVKVDAKTGTETDILPHP